MLMFKSEWMAVRMSCWSRHSRQSAWSKESFFCTGTSNICPVIRVWGSTSHQFAVFTLCELLPVEESSVLAELRKQCDNVSPFNIAKMISAENLILKHVQKEQYAKELSSIRRNESVSKSSPIAKICLVIRDGLIVVGGRLKHATEFQGMLTPKILPRNHQVSDMIIREYHNDAHLSTE